MKSHKETAAKGKLEQSSKLCFHHKISHSKLNPKQTVLLQHSNQRLNLPNKKSDRPLSFSSATIESTNKNIQKDKICHRSNLIRSKSVLASIKKDKYNLTNDVTETSERKIAVGEFAKTRKMLKMKELLENYDHKGNDDKTNNLDLAERAQKPIDKQKRSKSESRAYSPHKNIFFDGMVRETLSKIQNNGTSVGTPKSIKRDPEKFNMVRKFFEEPSLKRSFSLSSIKPHSQNKNSMLFKQSSKFKDLYNFFKNLEKLNELKRSTSCVDVRPIRRELDLIDYDVWKSTHDNVKTKKKFENLYAQIKEMEKAKHFLYECSDASSNKWKKDEDFGLRNRIRTINDLKKIFTSVNDDFGLKNKVNRMSLENDELFKKHGVSNCLIKMLSTSQMNKLRKQLNEIYQENIKENQDNQKVELKNNKNKLILKPLIFNRDLNIKNKIQYYENKLYCMPVGNTIYRARSDLEQNFGQSTQIINDKIKDESQSLKLTSRNRQSSKSISCLATDYQDREVVSAAKRMKLPFYTTRHSKSISTEDLSTYKTMNNVESCEKSVNSLKSGLKSNKGDIYERLNSFILKKLENINGKYTKAQHVFFNTLQHS